MKTTTAIKNLEEVARADKAVRGKNWKLTAEWRLIMEALQGREYNGYFYHKKDGIIRPCYYSGSGRFTSKQDHTAGVRYLLERANIRFTLTNDAPRGSETGNLIKLTHIEFGTL